MVGASGRRFSFRKRPQVAAEGATLLAALSRDRIALLRRSSRYHRPQGAFCGVGQCAGCLVRVNGRPNVRACRYVPAEGDTVTTETSWPGPEWDLLGAIGMLAPGGIDTLHGFRRPAFATRLYQRLVRRLAGTGAPPTDTAARAAATGGTDRTCDVAIVGGGDAGRAVVAELVAHGVAPVVLERSLDPPPAPGAELWPATTAVFLPAPVDAGGRAFTLLAFREPDHGVRITARSVVVATGRYDASLLFRGHDRPGVLSAAAALAFAAPPRRPPFRRAVVVGGGARVAEVLEQIGESVEAVVAPGEIRPEVVRAASDRGVLLYPRSLILATDGRTRVRGVRLQARSNGPRTTVACDALILAHRQLPHNQLFFQAGATMEWDPSTAAYFPTVGPEGSTSVPGLFAVGAAARVPVPERAGHVAALVRAIRSGPGPVASAPARSADPAPTELLGYFRELLRVRGHERWVVCPCEDVLLSEVEEAVRAGYRGIEVVKRYTSLGTGVCQGRYCLPDALLLLAVLEDRPPPEVGYITQRPPVVPTPLGALASLSVGTAAEESP